MTEQGSSDKSIAVGGGGGGGGGFLKRPKNIFTFAIRLGARGPALKKRDSSIAPPTASCLEPNNFK